MKKYALVIVVVLLSSLVMAGCGETISGVGKDAGRIGKGVKTIFVRGE